MKKILSVFMSLVITLSLAVPSFASAKDGYIEDLSKLYEKNENGAIAEGNSKFSVLFEGIKELQEKGYGNINADIEMKSVTKATNEPMRLEIAMDVKLNATGKVKELIDIAGFSTIPQIKFYMDDKDLYLNKDFINFVAKSMGSDKVIDKEYVRLTYNTTDIFNTKEMSTILKNKDKATQAVLNFIKKIDLGNVSLGLEKKSEGVYQTTLNSDEFVDLVDAFAKFILSDFRVFLDFYKELGIDYIDMTNKQYESIGLDMKITEEQIMSELKTAKEEYLKVSEKYLPLVKNLLKGTTVDIKEDFSKDGQYTSNTKINFVINLEVLKQFNAMFNDANGKVTFGFESNSTSKYEKDLKIDLPKDAEEIKMEELMPKMEEPKAESNEPYAKLEISAKDNSYKYYEDRALIKVGTIKTTLSEGSLKVDGKVLAESFDELNVYLDEDAISKIASQENYKVSDLNKIEEMEDLFTISWNANTKMVTIEL